MRLLAGKTDRRRSGERFQNDVFVFQDRPLRAAVPDELDGVEFGQYRQVTTDRPLVLAEIRGQLPDGGRGVIVEVLEDGQVAFVEVSDVLPRQDEDVVVPVRGERLREPGTLANAVIYLGFIRIELGGVRTGAVPRVGRWHSQILYRCNICNDIKLLYTLDWCIKAILDRFRQIVEIFKCLGLLHVHADCCCQPFPALSGCGGQHSVRRRTGDYEHEQRVYGVSTCIVSNSTN